MCTMYLFELFSKSIRVILISLRSNDNLAVEKKIIFDNFV